MSLISPASGSLQEHYIYTIATLPEKKNEWQNWLNMRGEQGWRLVQVMAILVKQPYRHT